MRLTINKVTRWAVLSGLVLVIWYMISFIASQSEGFDYEEYGKRPKVLHGSDGHVVHPSVDGIHVCVCADGSSLLGLTAAVNSISINTKHQVFYHLFTTDRDRADLDAWLRLSSLQNLTYEIITFDTSKLEHMIKVREARTELANVMNYVRYYYAELLPNLHGRVIHIDPDCIVQDDIAQLAHVRLKQSHIIAALHDCHSLSKRFEDFLPVFNSYINFHHPEVQKLQLNPSACAFNVGVYVVNLDRWRDQGITEKLEYWLDLNTQEKVYGVGAAGGGSQPPMMLVLYNKTTFFSDPMWHVRSLGLQSSNRISPQILSSAKLLHWSGRHKPWQAAGLHKSYWLRYHVPDPLKKRQPVIKNDEN